MTGRLLLVLVVGTCVGLMGIQASQGLEGDAEGTYMSEGSNTSNTWHGRFLVGGSHVEGSVTFSGKADLQNAEIQGSVEGAALSFAVIGAAAASAQFMGNVTGNEVRGTYTLGAEKGSWRGWWTLAPGLPAADGEPVKPLPPQVERAP